MVNLITEWLTSFFELLSSAADAAVAMVKVPAQALGIPPELAVVALVCAILIVAWRAMAIRWY